MASAHIANEIRRLVTQFSSNREELTHVLIAFAWLGRAVVDGYRDEGLMTGDKLLGFEDCLVDEFSMEASELPLFNSTRDREALLTNTRGLVQCFWALIQQFHMSGIAAEYLQWHTHRLTLQFALNSPNDARVKALVHATLFQHMVHWGALLTSDEPIPEWNPLNDDLDDEEDMEFETGPDVGREPCGDELNIDDFATPVTAEADSTCLICCEDLTDTSEGAARRLNCCTHAFHWGCLSRLINGVEEYSNKCPECRTKICEPRAHRPALPAPQEEDGDVGATYAPEESGQEEEPEVDEYWGAEEAIGGWYASEEDRYAEDDDQDAEETRGGWW